MRSYTVKLILMSLDWLGRTFIYNRHSPTAGGMIPDQRYGPDPAQRLDIITPTTKPPRPVIIYVHGGGWISGDKSSFTGLCRSFAQKGYLVFNINYRLGPKFGYPFQHRDVAEAIRWCYDHMDRHCGDKETIFLAGDSAGAQIVSWYCAAIRQQELLDAAGIKNVIPANAIKGQLLFYGVYDFSTLVESGFPFIKTMAEVVLGSDEKVKQERIKILSTIRHIHGDYPPTFISAGEKDPLYGQSHHFANLLNENNVQCKTAMFSLEEYPDAQHGYMNFPKRKSCQIALREALQFMGMQRNHRAQTVR